MVLTASPALLSRLRLRAPLMKRRSVCATSRAHRGVGAQGRRWGRWWVDVRQAKRKIDRTQALLLAQERAEYGVFVGGDGRERHTALDNPIDLTAVFGLGGGMRNRVTLPSIASRRSRLC